MKTYPKYTFEGNENKCHECQGLNGNFEMVMLPLSKWLKICTHPEEFLCHRCIEGRLGRELKLSDFPNKRMFLTFGSKSKINIRKIPVNEWFFEKRKWKI